MRILKIKDMNEELTIEIDFHPLGDREKGVLKKVIEVAIPFIIKLKNGIVW
jgi:hypothetical protein